MGVCAYDSDFNYDFGVSFKPQMAEWQAARCYYNYQRAAHSPHEEAPGVSVFYKDDTGDGLPHLLDLRAAASK